MIHSGWWKGVAAVALVCTCANAGETLFEETFEQGLDAWRPSERGRTVEGALELGGASSRGSIFIKDGDRWTDYAVEFDVRIDRQQVGWFLRKDWRGNGYLFILRGRIFSRFLQWNGKLLPAGNVELDPPIALHKTTHIRAEANGTRIRHTINGQLVDEWTDMIHTKGTFGFRQAGPERGTFDNVRVTKLTPPKTEAAPPAAVMTAPARDVAPVIDGKIDPDEWKQAARATGFSDLTGRYAKKQTVVLACWDQSNLYLAFESPKRFLRNNPNLARDADEIFRDDAIEINLSTGGETWIKLGINPGGSQWDGRYKRRELIDKAWNPEWQAAHHLVHDDYYVEDNWQAEVAIPFASLGLPIPKPGDIWGLQICRDFDNIRDINYPVQERWTSWTAATEGGFNAPSSFGSLRFGHRDRWFKQDRAINPSTGEGGIAGRLTAPEGSVHTLQVIARSQSDARLLGIARPDIEPGLERNVRVVLPLNLPETSVVTVDWQLQEEDGQVTAAGRFRDTSTPSFALTFAPLFTRGEIAISGDLSRMHTLPDRRAVRMQLTQGGQPLADQTTPLETGADRFLLRVPLGDALPGPVQARVELLDAANNRSVATAEKSIDVPEPPAWQKSPVSFLDKVPEPWTPVTVENDTGASIRIGTWNKTYTYEGGVLPKAIRMGARDLLAAPARLVIEVDEATPGAGALQTSAVSDLGVTLTANQTIGPLQLHADTRVEFDALAWTTLDVTPVGKEPVTVRRAYIELPLRTEDLQYMRGRNSMQFLSGRWYAAMLGDAKLDGTWPQPAEKNTAFSTTGWQWPDRFCNFYWIGGNDFGLFTLFKSPRYLHVKTTFSEVIEEKDRTVLRLYLADHPFSVGAEGHRWEFGLQATPTRPLTRRSQMMRTGFNNISKLDPASLELYLGRMDGKLRDKYFTGPELKVEPGDLFGGVANAGPNVMLGNPYLLTPRQKEIVARQHAIDESIDMRTILWVDLTYTPITLPHEWPYRYEWEQSPAARHLFAGEACTLVCPQPSWRDFFLKGLDILMKEHGVQGLYFDMTGPGSCNNPYHGCGYMEDGERKGEIPILKLRELFLSVFDVVHRNDPEGTIFYHSQVFTPFAQYVDMGTRGENWSGVEDHRTFSLPYYRTAYMVQHQYGVPFNFFSTHNYPGYRAPDELCTLAEVVGMSLLHDTLPCPSNSQQIPGLVTVWNALDAFGAFAEDTKWTPYWESGIGDWKNGIACSTYRNARNEHFLVMFNPDFDASHDLAIQMADFGAEQSYDIVSGQTDRSEARTIRIGSRDIRLLLLTP